MTSHDTASLSINQRLKKISRLTILALFILLCGMSFASFNISQNMKHGAELRNQINAVKDAQTAVLSSTLTAMDVIVDKADGTVFPERIEEFKSNADRLEKELFPLILISYKDNNNEAAYKKLVQDFGVFKKATQTDLVNAVTSRGGDEVFAALDDGIDGKSAEMGADLDKLANLLQEKLVDSLSSSERSANLLLFANTILFIAVIAGTYVLMNYIKAHIVAPIENITTETIGVISRSANSLSSTTSHLDDLMIGAAAATTQGSQRANIITNSIEGVAAAIEELASSISEIRRQATISTEVSALAVKEAISMSETIKNLNVATEGINEITDLINKIAEGTNLLALNATIEAARAGDAGKGFAVVATEVKNLAVKTAEATEEITTKIQEMQRMSNGAVAAIGNIQETISEINTANSNVMGSVEQQASATDEITRTISEATVGLKGTSEMIADINRTIHLTKKDSDTVLESAKTLLNQAEQAGRKTRILIDGEDSV